MGLFTDTVTIYKKQNDESYISTIVSGVQWSEKVDKSLETGKLTTAKTITVTFPVNALSSVKPLLETFTDEDAIFYGEINEEISDERGHRLSDLMKTYPKSGIIREVNDNSNRDMLKNIKVVLY